MSIRETPEYIAWRNRVFERDNYTCQECGATYRPPKEKFVPIEGGGIKHETDKGLPIHAHHIKQVALFPMLVTDIDNGITLCENCHWKTYKNMKRPGNSSQGIISLRFMSKEKQDLKNSFAREGLTLSQGIVLAALYIQQEIEAGRLRISKAGLFSRR